MARDRLAVGVVGCGLVAQAAHLPTLDTLRDRFRIAALADPVEEVRTALAERYRVPAAVASADDILAVSGLDALVVCTPPAAHADAVCAALAAGLHVFCEKPLCITVADADRIVAARDTAGRVVQVGYMKRFDPAYEAMLAEMPESAAGLRYVSVESQDSEWQPYFLHGEVVRGRPPPADVVSELVEREREQAAEAGARDDTAVRAFVDGYLGSLVHFVNLVHGLLERMGEPLPPAVADSAWWAGGAAITASAALTGGGRWDTAWIQTLGLHQHHERVAVYLEDAIRTLDLPSPWLRGAASVYERSAATGGARTAATVRSHDESFVRELIGFHDAVVQGAPCRTPPEQARMDIELLTAMFRRAVAAGHA
ncbi:MAG TPA: Gfo/Idh/MocA family oxidoreductase [Gaiellales bacterium]|nr:Gfo/Idh/MocA family oxidoreductase [Gaiellales bacterium]